MKICLIAEGCYPYVAGGVSSWVQMLMEGMPQHQFVLYTIGAEERQRGKFKYKAAGEPGGGPRDFSGPVPG